MKKLLLFLGLSMSFSAFSTVHTVQVWNGYLQFLPNQITIQLGDTIQWLPLDEPTMIHTITSDNIPAGAATFDYIWQAPADTFFQYVPTVKGTYDYVCTPHVNQGMTGQFIVEDTTVSLDENELKISVYPNPTSDFLRIESDRNWDSYSIIDLTGKTVLSGSQNSLLDLRTLPASIYFLEVKGIKSRTVRIVKY